ncbi:Terminal nucleotidyltransferase 4A [Camellia lanceoleosa]|uniref:Terminal nucleotidyltransferase 4A n=1 Tax=Camellia lanceoleosa TaxID=1840588 RepID=A0ACC0GRV3_9ERIC|nr:Terminal nucleotidyltransferase 4A [Camellia lanceoleosa]
MHPSFGYGFLEVDAISKWPPLQPLYFILKFFLQQRELNEVYTGGIGLYALLVMLIAMMQDELMSNGDYSLKFGIDEPFPPVSFNVENNFAKMKKYGGRLSAASTRAHTRIPKQSTPFQLPSGT